MTNIVFLTGGLGNQLFQTANALEISGGNYEYIEFESKSGSPRLNQNGLPEVYDYISFKPKEAKLKVNKLLTKIYRLNLLVSTKRLSMARCWLKQLLVITSSLMISLANRKSIHLQLSNGIGFEHRERIKKQKNRKLLIGYFQSYMYFNNSFVKSVLKLTSNLESLKVAEVVNSYGIADKIVVHIRRSDYLLEENFGILGLEYYANAIGYFKNLGYSNFVVFSDDVYAAKDVLVDFEDSKVEFFEELDLSSSQVLEIMTHGAGLIIANSTFSWWAGYLKKNGSATVVAPTKWFAKKDDPNMLIPDSWVRI